MTLSFTVDIAPLITPSVTIAGHDAVVLSAGGNSWTASATMLAGDAEGIVTFSAVVGSEDASATTTVEAITSVPDVVFDETAPVITLTGAPSLSLTVGDSFTDEGATTADIVDGVGVADVSGSVDTSSAGTYTLTYDKTDAAGNHAAAVTRTVTVNAPPAPPAPSSSGGGGGSGGSLYPVAPVFGDVPPASPPFSAAAAPQGSVLGAQTTNIPESSSADQTAPAETPAPAAQPPSSQRTMGGAVAQARITQAPVAETPPVALPDVEPQENVDAQVAASGLPGFSWWWLLLLFILLALGAGYWAWRKYKEYKKRHEPAL